MLYHFISIILDFLAAIAWPIVTLVIIYWLKDPLSKFFRNIKSISHGDTRLETNLSQQDLHEISTPINSNIDPTEKLQMFSQTTIATVRGIVEREVGINENNLLGRESTLYDYAKMTIIYRYFDRTYTYIFGSQIKILESLSATMQSKEFIKRFYDDASLHYPVLHNYPFVEYFNFLVSSGFVLENNLTNEVTITDLGRDFLRYIYFYNYNLDIAN